MINTYSIPNFKLEDFKKKIKKMSNKAVRLGLPVFEVEYHGSEIFDFEINLPSGKKKTVKIEYTQVTVKGEAPTVEGYKIIAMLERFEDKNIIKRFDTDTNSTISTESLAGRSTECEHCNSKRSRKFLFVLQDENGRLVQVGKSCLRDFTNCNFSAESIASYYEATDILRELERINEDDYSDYSGGNGYFLYELDEVLALSIHFTDKKGYAPSSFHLPTKQEVFNYMFSRHKLDEYKKMQDIDVIIEENKEKIKQVKRFFQESESSSDYTYNLKVILGSEYAEVKYFGYIVSAYNSYLRATERQTRREAVEEAEKAEKPVRKPSEYVGEVGKRNDFTLVFDKVISFSTVYGMCSLYFFLDKDDNVFLWSTSKDFDFEEGQKVSITGTIKEHKEYREVKQTVITRCKLK